MLDLIALALAPTFFEARARLRRRPLRTHRPDRRRAAEHAGDGIRLAGALFVGVATSLPSGFFGILFAVGYGRPTGAAGSIVLASTATSAVTLSVALTLLFPG